MEKEPITIQENPQRTVIELSALKFLDPAQIPMIDEALSVVGEFGEVRLIVERGRLRFVVTQRSFDAQKWQPGDLTRKTKPARASL
jgi:hypothetical protein